jgi:hypothetical protein
MNFLFRGIARRRLRAPNLPSAEVSILVERGAITVARPGRPTVTAPACGDPIEWRDPSGDRFQVRHGVDADGTLYQRFEGSSSVSINRFALAPDGRLVIDTTITAKRLPAPLRFRTTYQRVSGEGGNLRH